MRQPFLTISFIVVFALFGARASAAEPEREPEFSGEIILGATFPLTGYLEYYGQSAYYGATTCVRLVNAAGGVNGKKLVVEWRDNQSDPELAKSHIREFVEKHRVPAVLGPLLSDAIMAVRSLSDELKVVVMTPLATVDAATINHPWVFRSCFNNTAQAEAMVRFQMEKFGAKSAGVIFDSRHASSTELAQIFVREFTEAGGDIVGFHSMSDGKGETEYRVPLRLLARENPDFIFASCYALEATELIQAARESQVAIRFCGPDSWDNELVFDASGTRLIGTSFTSALFEQAFSYRPFQTFFRAMEQAGMDNPDAQAACAYDAVMLLANGLKNGESAEELRQGLLAIKRLPLATGRTSISPEGDPVKPVIIRIVERRGGRLIPLYAERYDP